MGGVFLSSILAATVLTLFSACDSPSSSWEEPVRDYFDKYTNTAAIEKQEISFQTQKDNSGATCIPSDGNKTITFYLRNPRLYTLDINFPEATEASGITVEQDMQDKTVIRLTYPQDYLLAHEGGQQIGGTIYLTESETLREFDPYSFSLKCNTPPPGVKGQSVQTASNGHFWVCFYVPTTELATPTHSLDTHTVFINGEAVATIGTDGSITAKPGKSISTTAPSGLAIILGSGASAFTGSSTGCTALYYDTGRNTSSGEFIRWSIYLEDEGGFKSKSVNADSIVTQVIPTITSTNDVLTCEESNKQTQLTPSVDSGTIVSCIWSLDTSSTTADGQLTTIEGNNAQFTANTPGVVTFKATITLADGRDVPATKTIRVLGLTIPSDDEIMIVGEADATVSPTPAGFPATPTYTWRSSDNSVAIVDSSGNVHAVSNGNATITAEASYGGKTVKSNQKNIYVYKVGNITGDSIGFAGDSSSENTMLLNLQIDKPSPEPSGVSISQTWASGTTTVAANPGTTSIANQRKVKPLKAGTTTISANVSISRGSVTKTISSPRTKALTIYGVSIAGNSMLSKTGSYNNLILTPSLKSGTSTYSGSETVTYSLSSSAPSIATTSDSPKKVTAAGVGEATITVTATIGSGANQKVTKATKKVNVIDVTGLTTFIAGEEERALTATTRPSGVTYTWSSTNVTGSASINSSTGKISATAKGTVTIKLTANRTGNSSDKCEISKTINICEMIIAGITGDSVSLAVDEKLPYKYSFSPAISYTDFQIGVNPTGKVNASWIDTNKVFYLYALTTGNTEVTTQLKIDGTQISKKVFTATVESGRNVPINTLSTYLSGLAANDKDHPYKINVTGLSTSNLSQLTTAIQNSSVYVDLSSTRLPSGITDDNDGDGLFYRCSKLVKAPTIPDDVTSMRAWFFQCYNLQTAPTLPNGVTDIWSAFEYCTSLKTPPTLPPNITSMNACFLGCSSLESAPEIPTNAGLKELCSVFSGCVNLKTGPSRIPGNIEDMQGCFNGAGLDGSNTITVLAAIYSSTKWGNAFKDCPHVKLYAFITGSDERQAVIDAINNATGNDPSKISFE